MFTSELPELRRAAAVEPPAPEASLRLARSALMPSSVIRSFDYRPDARELEVLFTTGRRYLYSGVPPEAVDAFRQAFSKGRHFNAHIRDHYPYREC